MFIFLFFAESVQAEGSKDINSNGGTRAFLYSNTVNSSTTSFPFPTQGTMKVYVKAGETLYLGSSAQGINNGKINLRAPDGTTFTSGTSTTVGKILNRTQEFNGPQPNAGGYSPFTQTVSTAQEGIWEVDFVAPGADNSIESSPAAVSSVDGWTQPNGPYVAAFDVSVRNAANTAFLTGRVFTNIFCGIMSTFNGGFNGIFYILTKDGYRYTLDNNGQAGNGFSFFVNNKGFVNSSGAASYQSINTTDNIVTKDPRTPDTQTDVTHKIFFNLPAADLPAAASIPGGGTTWLINQPFVPSVTDISFTGAEGTAGKAGSAPLGGSIGFNATSNGSYTINIDVNNNGVFTDPADRKLTGVSVVGINKIPWDGLDGLGNKIPAGSVSYNVNITLSLYSAEVHFPFIDVERNVNGIKLTRTTGTPDNTVYWDDSQIDLIGKPSSPIKNTGGLSSLANGHKWGVNSAINSDGDFGNNKSIDTWAYVVSAPITRTVTFIVQEADLEVVSLTPDITSGCVGQQITYTAVVKNNGPTNVTGSTFAFVIPAELSDVKITSAPTSGVTAITADSTKSNLYRATLDIENGATRTFTLKGKVSKAPVGKLMLQAAILRPADITDPDATNPDNAVPSDPFNECDALPSGKGCNNIKLDSTTFLALPKAGDDQSVEKNTVVTLTANTAGTWAQLGITPAIAKINSAAAATTNVSGLTETGKYNFIFTNANGCADTIAVNVAGNNIDAPNVLTPNGDGKNDVLIIQGIENFPGSTIAIYNRWGNEVYHSGNYKNDWGGQGLAEGTYYYLFSRKEKTTTKIFKGWIYLKH